MTTDHDDQPISPPPLPAWVTTPVEPALSPGAIERHILPSLDLLERAADLLPRIVADWRPPLAETPEVDAWLADYRRLCADD